MPDPTRQHAASRLDIDQSLGGKPGPSILLVDDNEQNLELLAAFMEELGGTVRTAPDGIEALKAVEAAKPDIMLVDIMMPRMSGYQLCKRIKAGAATKHIPVVMVTALNEVSDVEHAAECGADGFLSKPVNKADLIGRVRELLARKSA